MPDETYDPFALRGGVVAGVAARLRCTEGQLYSMVIGILLMTAVWSNVLPNVAWRFTPGPAQAVPVREGAPAPVVVAPLPDGLAPLPPMEGPAPGLEPPAPLGPVEGPSVPAAPSQPADPGAVDPVPPPTTGEPFAIVSGGWASRYAGTPLASFGVPEGSVPVSARGTTSENITFLTFRGDAGPLVLQVDPQGANRLPELALLRLCVVPAPTFTVGRGDVPLEQAPPMDCERSVDGVRSPTGDAFSFDLPSVDLTGAAGLAIGPVASPSSPDFQVVLRLPQTSITPDGSAARTRSLS